MTARTGGVRTGTKTDRGTRRGHDPSGGRLDELLV